MQLEHRYFVLKKKDVLRLPAMLLNKLETICAHHDAVRNSRGAVPLQALVIEHDWPEYDVVLDLLAARVDGKPPVFTQRDSATGIPQAYLDCAKTSDGKMWHYYVNFGYVDGKFSWQSDGLCDADPSNPNFAEERATFSEQAWNNLAPKILKNAEFGKLGEKHSHYKKDIRHLAMLDVYRVLQLFNVTDPAIQHAVKKLLVAGGRGAGKDRERDYREAMDSIARALQMIAEDCNDPN